MSDTLINGSITISFTDKKYFDDSNQLVTHFLDFPLWENIIAYFKLLSKVSSSVFSEQDIWEMCY